MPSEYIRYNAGHNPVTTLARHVIKGTGCGDSMLHLTHYKLHHALLSMAHTRLQMGWNHGCKQLLTSSFLAGALRAHGCAHAASSGLVASPNPIAAIPFARASGKDYFRTTIFFPANFVTLLAVIWLDGEHYFSVGTYTPNNIKL